MVSQSMKRWIVPANARSPAVWTSSRLICCTLAQHICLCMHLFPALALTKGERLLIFMSIRCRFFLAVCFNE
jgi:hypothetical protein